MSRFFLPVDRNKLLGLCSLAILFLSSAALAQTTVTVIGTVTPGDCAAFNSTTILKDAGTTCGGGGAGVPGGPNGSIQFNNSGVFGGYTFTQLTALLNVFTPSLQGVVPASGGGTTQFLRADATFDVPPTFTSGAPGYVPASGGGTANFLRADGTFATPGGFPAVLVMAPAFGALQ